MEHLEFIGLQSQIPAGDTAVGVLQPLEGSVVRTEDEQPSLQVILQSTDHPLDSTPSRWCCIGSPSLTASVWRTVLGGQPPAPAETTPPLAPCSKHRSAGEKRQGNLPVALGQIQCHEKATWGIEIEGIEIEVVNLCCPSPVRTHHLIVDITHSPCDHDGPLPLGKYFGTEWRE